MTLARILVYVLCCAAGMAGAQVRIDTPKGGWRSSEGDRASYTQPVNYPASSVSLQPARAKARRSAGASPGRRKSGPLP